MNAVQTPAPGKTAALLVRLVACACLVAGCGGSASSLARRELAARGVEPTDDAFLSAVTDGDRQTLELLLAAGIHPDASLLRAVRADRCRVIPALLAGGVSADGLAGARALLQAQRQDLADCVSTLERAGARVDARTEAGENQLTLAVAAGRRRPVHQMLEAGFPVDEPNSRGETGLLVAARRGDAQLLGELLERGADPDARDVDGWSALAWVARQGLQAPARRLLGAGADVDSRGLGGWTPLLWAARKGHVEMARLLLEAGADPDANSVAARTPLVWAASRGDTSLTDLLLAHGADPVLAFASLTPSEWARLHRHDDLAARLRAAESS